MSEKLPIIDIDEGELEFVFTRSSGPGGQNVNKVSTAVQLRYNIYKSSSLPSEVKERLIRISGSKVTDEGVLIIESNRFRSQERNRQEVLRRFMALVQQAAKPPKTRRPTQPTSGAVIARLEDKRKRGELKQRRRFVPSDED